MTLNHLEGYHFIQKKNIQVCACVILAKCVGKYVN